MDERRTNKVRTNTSDVVVEPARDRLRTLTMEANAQTSIPIVDVMLPSGQGDHLMIPQVNLSISGYEPDLLGASNVRSPSRQTQEISIMPQLDGPRSLLKEIPIWKELPLPEEINTERKSDNDDSRRPHRNWRPLIEEGNQTKVRDPLTKEDTLIEGLMEEDILTGMRDPLEQEDTLAEDLLMVMEDPLVMEDLLAMEDPLDLLVDKDHQALKDHLDQ